MILFLCLCGLRSPSHLVYLSLCSISPAVFPPSTEILLITRFYYQTIYLLCIFLTQLLEVKHSTPSYYQYSRMVQPKVSMDLSFQTPLSTLPHNTQYPPVLLDRLAVFVVSILKINLHSLANPGGTPCPMNKILMYHHQHSMTHTSILLIMVIMEVSRISLRRNHPLVKEHQHDYL